MNNQQVEIGVLMVSTTFFRTRNRNINSNTSTCLFGFSLNKARKLHQLPPPLRPLLVEVSPFNGSNAKSRYRHPSSMVVDSKQWQRCCLHKSRYEHWNLDPAGDGSTRSILRNSALRWEGPSLKLTASLHLRMNGWNTIVCFWDSLSSLAMLALGSVITMSRSNFVCKFHVYHEFRRNTTNILPCFLVNCWI